MSKSFAIATTILTLCLFYVKNSAQQYLSLRDAVRIGLEQNLNLTIIGEEKNLAEINTGNGAAGMLPTVTAQGDASYSASNTRQQFLDGRENAIPLGSQFRANLGARMDWTIFDGMAMFTRRDLLIDELELTSINLKEEAQTLSASISVTYQNLVLQYQIIRILEENIVYLEDLVKLSEQKLAIGSVSKLDVLQAKTDLNEVEGARQLAEMNYKLSVAEVNRILNRGPELVFDVDSSFLLPQIPMDYDKWVAKALQANFTLQRLQKTFDISQKEIELAKAQELPRINLNAGFDVGYLNSNVGFLVSNRSVGPFVGVNVTYNIFDGYRVKREQQLASLRSSIAELSIERERIELKNELFIQFQRYAYYEQQVSLEQQNLALADENFALAEALFRNGGISQFDLRQVRVQKLAIERRLVNAQYEMAIAYIGLLEISGENWL